jgi:hypothetical protein
VDGWVDGWVGGGVGGWMGGWVGGWVDGWVDGWIWLGELMADGRMAVKEHLTCMSHHPPGECSQEGYSIIQMVSNKTL